MTRAGRREGTQTLVLAAALVAHAFGESAALGAETRRIALRVQTAFAGSPDLDRLAGWAKREGVSIEVAAESAPVPAGAEAVYLSLVPVSEFLRGLIARFPVKLEPKGFVFDGRAYRGAEDAILLSDRSASGATFLIGNGRRAVTRLLRRALWRQAGGADFAVVSGELSKEGKFLRGHTPLSIDRASERDEIAEREAFFRALQTVEREGVRWRFSESERSALARWEPVLHRFSSSRQRSLLPLVVRLFPDPATKARYTGSSRPADLAREGNELRVDLDVSAPQGPDLVSPVLASAALGARDEKLLARPLLLSALGARAAGRWWGRDVETFGAFVRQARVEPTVEEIASSNEEVSPILAIGAAASWIGAGIRAEGEPTVLALLSGPEPALRAALARWAQRSASIRAPAPAARSLPSGFLRGISYAMSNSIDSSYASPRSRETLERLAAMSVNSVSIMPFAFSPDARRPALTFVHRHPAGETDEGTLRAVLDARSLGISAMVKPQIWVPRQFVGEISMMSEEDWRRWFDLYRRFIVHHAVVAEAARAALLCVGTELVGTEGRVKGWRETIAAVRLATGTPLLYASNWAAAAPRVAFWDALDAIGVDFYDSLSPDPSASDAALAQGVRNAVGPLAALARRFGKPVVFAEAGYPPVRGAWITPHDENSGRPPAREDAARAIAAVFRTLEREAWWKGVYWWKAFSDGQPARPDGRDFNVIGTPSERAISEGFGRLSRERP